MLPYELALTDGDLNSCLISASDAVELDRTEVDRVGDVASAVIFREMPAAFGALAIGSVFPLNLPLLATPTPQVKVVRYPEQSFPRSMH